MTERKRNRNLVDPKVQWAIARRLILHWCLFSFCLVLVSTTIQLMGLVLESTFPQALKRSLMSQLPVLIVLATTLPIMVLDFFKLSNRFAGPMRRLKEAMTKLPSQNEIQPLSFRQGDFWQDAAKEFNQLASDFLELKQRNAELEAKLSQAEQRELQHS